MVQRNLTSVGDSFFQFRNVGDTLTGSYLGSEPFQFQNGDWGTRHFIGDQNGVVQSFLGTYNLNRSLKMVMPGAYTEIELTGTAPTNRNQSPVKLFRVDTEQAIPLTGQSPLPGLSAAQPPAPPAGTPPPMSQHTAAPTPAERAMMDSQFQPRQGEPDTDTQIRQGNLFTDALAAQARQEQNQNPPPVQLSDTVQAYTPNGVEIYGWAGQYPLNKHGQIIAESMNPPDRIPF